MLANVKNIPERELVNSSLWQKHRYFCNEDASHWRSENSIY